MKFLRQMTIIICLTIIESGPVHIHVSGVERHRGTNYYILARQQTILVMFGGDHQ
jgi:hypothetical protein